jgi:hypothetical protein
MFKKIEIWILYLTILLSVLFALGFGVLVRQEIEGTTKKGFVDISFLSKPAVYLARLPEKFLMSLVDSDVILNDPWKDPRYFYKQDGFNGTPNSEESYLLLSRYDGDLQEGVVELVDLRSFEVLHTWNPDIDAFNDLVEQVDEFKYLNRDNNNKRSILMHPKLTTDGGLLFGWEAPLRKIDACSNLVFQNTHDKFHHSIETDIEGNIWVPSHMYPQTLSKKMGENYLDDGIVKLSAVGNILFEKSVSQIFIENGLKYLIFAHGNYYERDPIHLNDIQPVNYDGEYWKKGDVFLSLRSQSMIVLYRPSTNEIIWKGTGPFLHQHDVNILDDHRISIFNNNSINVAGGSNIVDGHNEIIIYNFKTNKFSRYFQDSLVDHDVRSIEQGRGKIIRNGDLYIEDSHYGRTLYFNADGSLRWSHVNRAQDKNIYIIGWSRILYSQEDIKTVNNLLTNKGACNE